MARDTTGHSNFGKPRLLAVATEPVWPVQDGFALRAFSLLRELSHVWAITLLAPPNRPGAGPMPDGVCEHVPLGLSGRGLLYAWHFDAGPLRAALADLVPRTEPLVALLFSGAEGAWIGEPGFPPAVGDRVDCCTYQFWRELRRARTPRALAWAVLEMAHSIRHERRAVRALAATICVGERDKRVLELVSGGSVDVVPNGSDIPEETGIAPAARPTVAFTGTLDYDVNGDAALFAARRVWPLIRASVPDARFVIAGRHPTPDILALRELPGIEIEADVADMKRVLMESWVAIAPMRIGSGIKNKVLEAWACGRPVVMTPLATNGLELPLGAEAFVASRPGDLARAAIRLLTDEKLRLESGERARALIRNGFTWTHVAARLTEILRRAAQAAQPAAT